MEKTTPQTRTKLQLFVSRFADRDVVLFLSLVVGAACGFAAVLLDYLIQLIRGLAYSNLTEQTRYLYFILPGAGMLVSLLIVKFLVRDNIGHGVTKVLVAVSKNDSKIRPHNMYSSVLTSGITIGLGGSVGAEAPIVYTGAAIGSNFARWFGLSHKNMTILLGCGAAGAIAGIFKAPLAGILFTLEILLFNISMTSILPLLISTVSATVISYLFVGVTPQFDCVLSPFSMRNIPAYLVLGAFCAGVSLYFNKTTLWLEDIAKKSKNPYLRWCICALLLGTLIFLFPPLFGEGYSTLQTLLHGEIPMLEGKSPLAFFFKTPALVPLFFFLVLLAKVFSMTFTNAGGGVGGTFGPTLVVGGFSGFVVASTLNLIFINSPYSVPVSNFVLVGMAGTMAGVMQAPMTAIFLIAEISGGYDLLIPLIITASISYGISHAVDPYSIYTKRIAKKGELLTHDSDQAVLTLLKLDDFIEKDFRSVMIDVNLGTFVTAVSDSTRNIFPVLDARNRFHGYVVLEDIRKDMFKTELYDDLHVYNFMQSAPDYVFPTDNMQTVMDKFEKTGAWTLPVVSETDRSYIGFVSKSKIFGSYRERLREVSHD